jgi:hypothetical protein
MAAIAEAGAGDAVAGAARPARLSCSLQFSVAFVRFATRPCAPRKIIELMKTPIRINRLQRVAMDGTAIAECCVHRSCLPNA